MRVALRASDVQVPSLVGRTVNEATAALADRDLALRVEENQRPDDKIEVGKVMQQEPAPASRAGVSAPSASGSARDPSARSCRHSSVRTNAPHKAACSSRAWWCRPCPSSDPATILPTSSSRRIPRPTSRAPEVSILLNRGELSATYVMPDVIGMDGERAADALRQPGLPRHDRRHAALPRRAPGHRRSATACRRVSRGRRVMRSRSR